MTQYYKVYSELFHNYVSIMETFNDTFHYLRYGYRDWIDLIQPAYKKSHLLSNNNFPHD